MTNEEFSARIGELGQIVRATCELVDQPVTSAADMEDRSDEAFESLIICGAALRQLRLEIDGSNRVHAAVLDDLEASLQRALDNLAAIENGEPTSFDVIN